MALIRLPHLALRLRLLRWALSICHFFDIFSLFAVFFVIFDVLCLFVCVYFFFPLILLFSQTNVLSDLYVAWSLVISVSTCIYVRFIAFYHLYIGSCNAHLFHRHLSASHTLSLSLFSVSLLLPLEVPRTHNFVLVFSMPSVLPCKWLK